MRILLTGGSGDVGTLLSMDLLRRGDVPVVIDMAAPKVDEVEFVKGSILDRTLLQNVMKDVDCVVHIAAWHGIHESEKTKTAQEFHDLNVTGTFNTLQTAAEAGVKKFIFISSTSVRDTHGIYGHTKLLGEEMVKTYTHRHDMDAIILRPRAFIPPWNKTVYKDFLAFAAWFGRGAVHINDFKDACLLAIDMTPAAKAPIYMIDGAYDYTAEDFKNWDKDGPGSTFKKHYPAFVALAEKYGLDMTQKPRPLDIPDEQKMPGYVPSYTMKNLLEELRDFGIEGPPAPFSTPTKKPKNPKPDL